MYGQPQIAGLISLDVKSVNVAEIDASPPPALPLQPFIIIDPNNAFEVWAEVTLDGHLISLLNGTGWSVEYYAEGMGTTADLTLGSTTGTLTVVAGATHVELVKNDTQIKKTGGSVPPGLYKLTCVFKSGASNYILGFAEGGLFQIA